MQLMNLWSVVYKGLCFKVPEDSLLFLHLLLWTWLLEPLKQFQCFSGLTFYLGVLNWRPNVFVCLIILNVKFQPIFFSFHSSPRAYV